MGTKDDRGVSKKKRGSMRGNSSESQDLAEGKLRVGDRSPRSNVDRAGFDLGGSTGETTAGTGLGFGADSAESRLDRSLPGRRGKSKLTIPRWSGPSTKTPPPSKK